MATVNQFNPYDDYENAKLNSMMHQAQMQAAAMLGYGNSRNYEDKQYASLPPATPAGPDTRLLLLEDTP